MLYALIAAGIVIFVRWYIYRDFFVVLLVRHGESTQNDGTEDVRVVGDDSISLNQIGLKQAFELGQNLGRKLLARALIYFSPFKRARQTRKQMLRGAGFSEAEIEAMPRYMDELIREVDHGYEDVDAQDEKRKIHGYFYYRFDGGESPADGALRVCMFHQTMWSQVKRHFLRNPLSLAFWYYLLFPKERTVVIVAHGLTNRLFVKRWLHLDDETFAKLANPHNCDVITIAPTVWMDNPQLSCGRWSVNGLRLREEPR